METLANIIVEIMSSTWVVCTQERILLFLVFPFEGMMIWALCHVAPHSEIAKTK